MRLTGNCFTEFKAGFEGWWFDYIYSLFVCLACTLHLHVGGDRGITRKYRNHEASWSTRKVLVATQKQAYWWDAFTETTYQQLLQMVTDREER